MRKLKPVDYRFKSTLQKITRDKAEKVFLNNSIVCSGFNQNKEEIRFYIALENKKALLVTYNHQTKEKTFFIKNRCQRSASFPDIKCCSAIGG